MKAQPIRSQHHSAVRRIDKRHTRRKQSGKYHNRPDRKAFGRFRPVAVGFFFSLGHSTIVIIASAAIALATGALQNRFESFRSVGGVIGTLVSALAVLHQLSSDIVNGGNVVRIDSMAKSKGVSENGRAQKHRVIMKRNERPYPGKEIAGSKHHVQDYDFAAHWR
jgi:hypothetical protein